MPPYEVAGIVLDADLSLPELPEATEDAPVTWTVRRGAALPDVPLTTIHEFHTQAGAYWASLAAGDDAVRLSFHDRVDFHVDTAARAVTYAPADGLPEITLRHLLVDQLIPHLLAVDGALVLHASCVGVGGRAMAFVGPTGAGKSSLAAAFVQEGATLLADDFVLLADDGRGGYLATPAYPSLRLWTDAADHFAGPGARLHQVADYTAKRRWEAPPDATSRDPLPLHAVVAPGSEPAAGQPDLRIGRLRGADAFAVLYPQAFRVERTGRSNHEADLDRFVQLAARVPVFMVEHRRDYALLPQLVEAIVDATRLA